MTVTHTIDFAQVNQDRLRIVSSKIDAAMSAVAPAVNQEQESRRLLPVTDVEHHDPHHFIYPIKVSGLDRLLNPNDYNWKEQDPYYSLSLISQDHLATFYNLPFGLVMGYPDQNVLAVLKRMDANIVTVRDKSPTGLMDFLNKHRRKEPSNIIFEKDLPGNEGRHLTVDEIFSPLPRMIRAEYGKNTEMLVLNNPDLQVKSAILIVSKDNPIEKILKLLNEETLDSNAVQRAVLEGLPVVIVGEKEVDLQGAKAEFMRAYPEEEEFPRIDLY